MKEKHQVSNEKKGKGKFKSFSRQKTRNQNMFHIQPR